MTQNSLVLLWGYFSSWNLKIWWGVSFTIGVALCLIVSSPLLTHRYFCSCCSCCLNILSHLLWLGTGAISPESISWPSSILTSLPLSGFCHLPHWMSFCMFHRIHLTNSLKCSGCMFPLTTTVLLLIDCWGCVYFIFVSLVPSTVSYIRLFPFLVIIFLFYRVFSSQHNFITIIIINTMTNTIKYDWT